MKQKIKQNKKGYIALVSILIVASLGLTISIAVTLRGIEELQISFADSQAGLATNLADTCIEEGLNRLRLNWQNYNGGLSIGSDSCIINVVSSGTKDSGTASLEAIGYVDIFQQRIYTEVDNNLEITLWQNN